MPDQLPAQPALPNTGFIRTKQLIPTFVPVSKATLWRMVKDGRFPKPVKLSAGVSAWDVGAVRRWINSHSA